MILVLLPILLHYAVYLVDLLINILPWLVLGFILAAVVEEFAPTEKLLQYFGQNNLISLGRATLAGLVVSVCSCGAIPLAASLRRRGASTATALTFLLATPWGGFIHLIILSSFVGILNVFVLFVLSLLVSFGTGLFLARLENRQIIESKLSEQETIEAIQCYAVHEEEGLKRRLFICVPRRVWEITRDIGKYLLIGLLLAAILAAFVPSAIVTLILGNTGFSGLTSVIVAFPLAVIIELCSEGFAILAGQLYVMGANLAVVFTLMLVGVSTDFTELSMIFGKFGKRSMVAYVGISTTFVLLLAFGLAIWWPRI